MNLQEINKITSSLEEKSVLKNILADIQDSVAAVFEDNRTIENNSEDFIINPTLHILESDYSIAQFFEDPDSNEDNDIIMHKEHILIWKNTDSEIMIEAAYPGQLLAIKILLEDLDIKKTAEESDTPLTLLKNIIRQTSRDDILLAPKSKIRRQPEQFKYIPAKDFISADTFTIQWHITNQCDLNCLHCYDRTDRSALNFREMNKVLDDLETFCTKMKVFGHVCFSGGNPFISPDFKKIYAETAKRGFSTSILANPVSEDKLLEIIEIQEPGYFQISLEGLENSNDVIRGKGSFKRAIDFLAILKKHDIESCIMLTLTKNNIDEIIPLAEFLKDKADYFTFNRLSAVGQGAQLMLPEKDEYLDFLSKYIAAAKNNPVIGFKDNLINLILNDSKKELFDGCTGYGCGAAFNFCAILPDGEVHACRKFPSLIGNIREKSLLDIYNSSEAQRYRHRPEECDDCEISYACGGCMAIASSAELDISKQKDPFCKR